VLFCTSCGTAADDDAKFCIGCGLGLHVAQSTKTDDQADNRAWLQEKLRTMEPEATCAYCLHRGPKNVCGFQTSPNFRHTIDHTDHCDSFENNPAELDFIRAIFMDGFAGKFGLDKRQAAAQFRKAIDGGLPKDDEVNARLCSGKLLDGWIQSLDLSVPERLKLPETARAISDIETALTMDRDGGFGFFADPRNRYQLRRLDLMYFAKGGMLSIEMGQGDSISDSAAIEYWEEKLSFCEYLPSNPLLSTLTEAGFSYSRLGKIDSAIKCFESVITAAPVNPFDHEGFEAGLREKARASLTYLYQERQSKKSSKN
jgi:hypothetical protein